MFKTSIRKSVSLAIVAVILLSGLLLSGCVPEDGYTGVVITWNFSYLYSRCDLPPEEMPPDGLFTVELLPEGFSGFPFTVGEVIELLLSNLTGPESPCSNVPTDIALYLSDTKGTRVIPDDSTLEFLADATEDTLLYFGPTPKNGEIIRLTLFGYVLDNGNSCVLWSLDGTPNARPNEKCGGDVKLVCTVRLVDKSLKYSCKDGYEWLGNQIITDPDWKSWAEQFASKNGRP